ncbi:WD40-repeat-containing domain protein [Podospora didyma]|uniref:WD40-repeat-containing domain protein n=1 Tax=Podospora didyma TaxID=330526 RepID=A0AAE0N2J0_9PEZI|nr:WD40-repeat-containing domain protein [Podospora didyma]
MAAVAIPLEEPSVSGAYPETTAADLDTKEFKVSPLPATDGAVNPIKLEFDVVSVHLPKVFLWWWAGATKYKILPYCPKAVAATLIRSNLLPFSPDGQRLASGSYKTIKIWDPTLGQCLQTLEGHDNSVQSVAFSPDGQRLASGSKDKTIKIWDPTSGQCLQTLEGHNGWVQSVAFSPDGRYLLTDVGRIEVAFSINLR